MLQIFGTPTLLRLFKRTPLDLLLFDWLSLKQNVDGARNLVLKGEHPITTTCLGDRKINGIADYVIEYCHAASTGDETILESIYVVIEARRRYKTDNGILQMIFYLSGVHQTRAKLRPEKIVKTVYGILTDSVDFRFFRLDENRHLSISKVYSALDDNEKPVA